MPAPHNEHPCTFCGTRVAYPAGQPEFECPACGRTTRPAAGPLAAADWPAAGWFTPQDPLTLDGPAEAPAPPPPPVPPPVAAGPRPVGVLAGVALVLAGLVVGGLVGLALSRFKAYLSVPGMALVPAAFGVLFIGGLVAVCLLRRPDRLLSPGTLPAAPSIRRGLMAASLFGAGCFVVTLGAVGAEAFGPKEGYVQAYRARVEKQRQDAAEEARLAEAKRKQDVLDAEEAERKRKVADEIARLAAEEAKRLALEKKQWAQADLIVMNHTTRAVGLKLDRDAQPPKFRLVAKAENGTAGPLRHAWDGYIPVLAQEPFAGRLFDRYEPDQVVEGEDAAGMLRRLQARSFLPPRAELVSFVERATKTRRVGYLLRDTGSQWMFSDLIPRTALLASPDGGPDGFDADPISPNTDVEPGSLRRGLTTKNVQETADYLDFSLYAVLTKLQPRTTDDSALAVRPTVWIHGAIVRRTHQDALMRELRAAVGELRNAKVQATLEALRANRDDERATAAQGGLAVILMHATNILHDLRKARTEGRLNASLNRQYDDWIRAIQAEYDALANLQDASQLLQMEIRTKLTQAGVRVVDRSDEAIKSYSKEANLTMTRPSADDAIADRLVEATHLLIPEISRSTSTGEYHLSMRLLNLRTLETEWAGAANRALRQTARSGVYRNESNGFTIRVVEKGNQIEVSLVSNIYMDRFSMFAVRNRDNTVTVKETAMVMRLDKRPVKWNYHPEAELIFLSDSALELKVQAALLNTTHCEAHKNKLTFMKVEK